MAFSSCTSLRILAFIWGCYSSCFPQADCIGFVWQGFGSGGVYRGGFCEKLLEAYSVSDRATASQLQDRPITGQGRAQQQQW